MGNMIQEVEHSESNETSDRLYPYRGRLTGYRGLALAIIQQAALDYLHNKDKTERIDAARFFIGDWYRYLLRMLGLSGEILPEGITRRNLHLLLFKHDFDWWIENARYLTIREQDL